MCHPGGVVTRSLKALAALLTIVVVGAVAVGGSLALLVPAGREVVFGTTSHAALTPEIARPAERSIVYDANGDVMTSLFLEDRAPVRLEDIPDHVVDAVLAIEDRNFYDHDGIDRKATVRALFRNIDAGEVEEGGSTITQQLIKNTLFPGRARELRDKVREAFLALELEKEMTKDEILEQYLNIIYLGEGAYGIRSAAERYFQKQPDSLTIGEGALLAGLIKSPEGRNPITAPQRARARRTAVLRAMLELDMITRAELLEAEAEPLPTTAYSPLPRTNDYFLEEVKKSLLNDNPHVVGDVGEALGASDPERFQRVFRGGLRIFTTFDPEMQVNAVTAVNEVLPPSQFTAALVAIDNGTGAVRAMVGGPNFEQAQFNVATQGIRQTGSAFKAVTLAAALREGWAPDDSVNSRAPCTFNLPGAPQWRITASGAGTISVRDATSRSLNCAFARMAIALGPEKIVDMAHRLGIRKNLQAVPSITLGTQPTSVLEMAGAFSVFANDGIRREPIFVTRVEGPEGEVLYNARTRGQQVLDPNLARTETEVLRRVITSGTGRAADIGRPAAGKTGTTDDYSDAWFVGYTPQMTTAVWMGHPNEVVPMFGVGGRNVTGGSYPAQMWARFMRPALEGEPALDFVAPDLTKFMTRGYIDEDGRRITWRRTTGSSRPPTGSAPTTTSPTTSPPTSVAPPPPTTAAPTTLPPTVPPTTAPPPPTTAVPPTTGGGAGGAGKGPGGGGP